MADDGNERARPSLRIVAGGATRESRADDALLAAFLVGDDEAFGELVRRNEGLVLAIVRRYARTPEDGRDLAQRTFLRAFEAARRSLRRGPRERVPFRRWLVRIAVNLAKNHLRDEHRLDRVRAANAAVEEEPDRALSAPDALARAERAARVRSAILGLPRRQREVLTLRVDAELSFAEIAEALGTTENSAKVSFHHGMVRLRELLAATEDRP